MIMDTVRSSDPMHRELELLLPWYVKGRLDANETRQVQAHLNKCPTCRAEADGLTKLFTVHEQTMVDRPVDEARLNDVFARIDAYEAQRTQRAERLSSEGDPRRSSVWTNVWSRLGAMLSDWLSARPALLAGTFAALVLAVIAIPMLRTTTAPDDQYGLLSSGEPASESLSLRVRFTGTPTRQEVERLVQSSLRERKMQGAYRIEPRGSGEYVVTLQQKPSIDALSGLVGEWQSSPNVADVAIEGTVTP
jgi:hypothetical protein